jgi:UDP-glucose 4-epimerase
MLHNSHVLVTGGLGAIGSALCRKLLQSKIQSLTIIDDCSSSSILLTNDIVSNEIVTHYHRSILNEECLHHAFIERPVDVVFHLAANFANQNSIDNPITDCKVNSVGTMNILEYSRRAKVKKFIYASSSCVYGKETMQPPGYHDYELDTPYAINKLHGEHLTNFYNKYHNLNTTVLRYFNSFGPGEIPGAYRNVIPNFFMKAIQGKQLLITGGKDITRDFNFVDNTVEGTLLAAQNPASNGKIYNIGSGKATRVYEIAEIINQITGNTSEIALVAARNWDSIPHRCANIDKTVEELQYNPILDLEAQLRATYDWLNKNYSTFI